MKKYVLFIAFIALLPGVSLVWIYGYLDKFTTPYYKHLILTSKVSYSANLSTLIIFWVIIPVLFTIMLFFFGYKLINSIKPNLEKIKTIEIDTTLPIIMPYFFLPTLAMSQSHWLFLIAGTALIYILSFYTGITLILYFHPLLKDKIKYINYIQKFFNFIDSRL